MLWHHQSFERIMGIYRLKVPNILSLCAMFTVQCFSMLCINEFRCDMSPCCLYTHYASLIVGCKKDAFFLQNIFIWALEVQKSHVVLTDYCRFYGLPLTSHVILTNNCTQKTCSNLGRNNMGSQWQPIKLTVVGQYNMVFSNLQAPNENILKKKPIFFTA